MSSDSSSKSPHVVWHQGHVPRLEREELLGQRGCVVWFTGLSGSGKSTMAGAVERELVKRGKLAYLLDGDNVRHGLNGDLGFSPPHRQENIRRIGEVSALFADCGVITLTAFISPYEKDRRRVKETVGPERFLEIYVYAPLEICEKRDPKGLYKKARKGQISDFTGLDAPYEAPSHPDLCLNTHEKTVDQALDLVVEVLKKRGILSAT